MPKSIKIAVPIIAVMLILVVFGLPLFARAVGFRGHPELRAAYDEFSHRPLTLPPDVLEVKQPSPATRGKLASFGLLWKQDGDRADAAAVGYIHAAKDGLSDDEAAQLADELKDLEPLMIAFRSLVAQPDFDLDLGVLQPELRTHYGNGLGPAQMDYRPISALAKLCEAKADLAARSGDVREGLDWSQTIGNAGSTDRRTTMLTKLVAVGMYLRESEVETKVLAKTEDPLLLRSALVNQIRTARELHQLNVTQNASDDWIGSIRETCLQGAEPPALPEHPTGQQIFAAYYAALADYGSRVALPNAPDGNAGLLIQQQIASDESMMFYAGGTVEHPASLGKRFIGSIMLPMTAGILFPDFRDAGVRYKVATASFDLMRAETGRRLAAVEGGAAAAASPAPQDLNTGLADPFAADEAPLRVADGKVYSIGPDGRDDAAAVRYDPTNGTISAGDIFADTNAPPSR